MPSRLSRLAAAAGAAARTAVEHRRSVPLLARRGASGLALGNGAGAAPDNRQLQRIISDLGLQWALDDDGDLVVRWEHYNIYFFHYGVEQEVLQARLYLNRRFDVELRPTLALVLDDWNRSKLFPKAYTVLPDDGLVGVCAEQAFDFEGGTTAHQLSFTIAMWLQNLQQFADWIEEHV